MHHLLARVTNCRRPAAALKALEKIIKEVEQYVMVICLDSMLI
jgi:hypothetical protein